jgi:hypothetical protein
MASLIGIRSAFCNHRQNILAQDEYFHGTGFIESGRPYVHDGLDPPCHRIAGKKRDPGGFADVLITVKEVSGNAHLHVAVGSLAIARTFSCIAEPEPM